MPGDTHHDTHSHKLDLRKRAETHSDAHSHKLDLRKRAETHDAAPQTGGVTEQVRVHGRISGKTVSQPVRSTCTNKLAASELGIVAVLGFG